MNVSQKIISYLKRKNYATGKELAEFLGISRQALNRHIKKLILQKMVFKEGVTKGSGYKLYPGESPSHYQYEKRLSLEGLEEDRVFEDINLMLNLKRRLSANVHEIVNYAFTEMLNNAIEHSDSKWCIVDVSLNNYNINFSVKDYGIGIFYSIYTKRNLPDEITALGELIKGKTTTMADRHTGEGVFFTSKCGDTVSFRSHKLALSFDNLKPDVFVAEQRFTKGTDVRFMISRQSKRKLGAVFQPYAAEDYDYRFERTRVFVKLYRTECLSRSEARRMLLGLDKFREIILDFKGVKMLGRGFTDEVFRVFQRGRPEIIIKIENLSPVLKPVIGHVVDNNF